MQVARIASNRSAFKRRSTKSVSDETVCQDLSSVLVTLWQRAAFLRKAIAPCLPDLGTGPKIAPITNAWGGSNEQSYLDACGLRRGDFALRRCVHERAGWRRGRS